MNLIEDLNWRYAAKRMNGKKIEETKLARILESINLAPTSMGLQAFKVIVVKNEAVKKQLFEQAAPAQLMIEGCSHLLVFAAYNHLTIEDVDEYLQRIAVARETTIEALDWFREMHIKTVLTLNDEQKLEWMSKQTYIAMGFALYTSALEKVDSTPVEGFSKGEVDRILGLKEKGLTSTLLMPLGYRDESNDPYLPLAKVRRSEDDLFIHV